MKLKFYQRVTAKRGDKVSTATIYVRFTIGHKVDTSCRLPYSINANYWDDKKECIKLRAAVDDHLRNEINGKIAELRVHLQREYAKGNIFDYKGWLKTQVQSFFGIMEVTRENKIVDMSKGDPFFTLYDKFLEQRVCGKTRLQHFISLRERLLRFKCYKVMVKKDSLFKFNIHTFTNDLFIEFSNYLRDEYSMIDVYPVIFKAVPYSKYYKPRPMGANSLSHLQINLRIFLKWAYANEFTQNHSFMLFDIKVPQYGTPYYLTIEERDHLLDFDFPDGQFKEKYEMERDTFIFQCLVGCRISDERSFTRDNVNGGYLEYIPIKTRKVSTRTVRVPLVPKAVAILDKYKDREFKDGRLFHFYQFSIYEKDLKEIFKIAGLSRMVTIYNSQTGQEEQKPLHELASTHLARRTFIGNLYKKVKDPNIIASMSGHVDGSKAFKRYRAIDDDIKNDAIRFLE